MQHAQTRPDKLDLDAMKVRNRQRLNSYPPMGHAIATRAQSKMNSRENIFVYPTLKKSQSLDNFLHVHSKNADKRQRNSQQRYRIHSYPQTQTTKIEPNNIVIERISDSTFHLYLWYFVANVKIV